VPDREPAPFLVVKQMSLHELLSSRQGSISEAWCDRILETYPPQTVVVMKRQGDPFANPVGQTIRTATAEIVEGLVAGRAPEALREPLDRIIRIRSIQDFTPAQAIGFLFELKRIVRAELPTGVEDEVARELLAFEGRLEQMTLLGFDIYVGCRERYFEVRVSELKRSIASKLRRLGDPDLEDGSKTRDAGE
jgi:hypothetical protein